MKQTIYNDKVNLNLIQYQGKEYPVKYKHQPNYIRRSEHSKLAVVVGKTTGTVEIDDKTLTATAECWVNEPFVKKNGELVVYGRLLKQLNLRLSKGSNKIIPR